MEKMKFYTEDEARDALFGKVGSPQREKFEITLELDLVGDAVKAIRKEKSLSQEELGAMIGVQKAQISKIENGKNLTLATVLKVFNALGVSAKLQIG